MPNLPDLAELHDDIFWCLQFTAERVALLRSQVNQVGQTGFLARMLADETARADRLADAMVKVHRLIPHEPELRRLCDGLLAGGERRKFRDAHDAIPAA